MRQSVIVAKDVQACDHILAKTVFSSVVVKNTSSISCRIVYWRQGLYTAEINANYNKNL